MAVREYCLGNTNDLPAAREIEQIDLAHAFRPRLVPEDGPTYGDKVAPEVIDMPGNDGVMLRRNPHAYGKNLDTLAQTAIQHFEALEHNGIRVPDLRFIIYDDYLNLEPEALYTVVRRLDGSPLHTIQANRPSHARKMVEGMSKYYAWSLTEPDVDSFLIDTYRTDNFFVTRPEDPESPVWMHDVEPWFSPTHERNRVADEIKLNVLALHYLNRDMQLSAQAVSEAHQLVEGRVKRVVRTMLDTVFYRPQPEENS